MCHSLFNTLCTALLLPQSGLLEKLAYILVPEGREEEKKVELDERLLATPSIALGQCDALLTDLERTSDHCSNIALGVIDAVEHNMNAHEAIRSLKKNNPVFRERYESYTQKYTITH